MRSRLVTRIAAAALIAVAAVALYAQTPGGVYRAQPDKDGVQRIRIVAGSYFFKPQHIVVKARTPVELTLVKEPGLTPHDFVLKAPEVGVVVEALLSSDPVTVTFTPTAPGRYDFYCSNRLAFLPSHRERGMEGTFVIVE